MSFWQLSDGASAAQSAGDEYEVRTEFEPIPNGTQCIALIDEAQWHLDQTGIECLKLRWGVLEPDAFKNRKLFQTLWVSDLDPRAKKPAQKRDTALRMLAAIDRNCGGRLAGLAGRPSDEQLTAALCNRPMTVRVLVWKVKGDRGDDLTGNWISAVGAARELPRVASGGVPQPTQSRGPAADLVDYDDEIPF